MDELIGSLLTFKMAINDKLKKINKGVTFKVNIENDYERVEEDTYDNIYEFIALLAKGFGKVMRRLDRRSRNNVTTSVRDNLPPNFKGLCPQHKGGE